MCYPKVKKKLDKTKGWSVTRSGERIHGYVSSIKQTIRVVDYLFYVQKGEKLWIVRERIPRKRPLLSVNVGIVDIINVIVCVCQAVELCYVSIKNEIKIDVIENCKPVVIFIDDRHLMEHKLTGKEAVLLFKVFIEKISIRVGLW